MHLHATALAAEVCVLSAKDVLASPLGEGPLYRNVVSLSQIQWNPTLKLTQN